VNASTKVCTHDGERTRAPRHRWTRLVTRRTCLSAERPSDLEVRARSGTGSLSNMARIRSLATVVAPVLVGGVVVAGDPGYRPGLDRDGDGVACE